MPIAYSYLRFSSPEQAKGDSVRRQTANRDAWLKSHPNVQLNTSLKLTDAGRSAFKRTNAETYALAQFVELIKAGRIQAGSYLLVENLDRLSREEAGEATELFLSIVNKGIVVVQMCPTVLEFKKPVNTMQLMFAIVELSRGHSESAVKSERSQAVWARKQREASPGKIVTTKLPGWIVERDGALVLDKARADIVRRIFALSVEGQGSYTIAKRFNEEGVPVLGRQTVKGTAVRWADATVRCILVSPATYGVYVPYHNRNKGKPQLEPVANYFPATVDEATFRKAQNAMQKRAIVGRGRKGKRVNLFSGLLIDYRSKGTLTYRHSGKTPPVIVPIAAIQGRGGKCVSFPAEEFELAILQKLRELTVKDLQGEDDTIQKIDVLEGRLHDLNKLVKLWTDKMDDPSIVDAVATKLGELKTKRKQLVADLDAARQEAVSPLKISLDELRTPIEVLIDNSSDETRTKVRTAIRRVVAAICGAICTKGKDKNGIRLRPFSR